MSVMDRMKLAFAKLDGCLFSEADVEDAEERMKEQEVAMMSWADPFKPDDATPECVKSSNRSN